MSSLDIQSPAADRFARLQPASIQVICLGSGGGPSEDNVNGFLVRSTASGWVRNSLLAVDAGVHMSAITRILDQELPSISNGHSRADPDGDTLAVSVPSPQKSVNDEAETPSSPFPPPPPQKEPMILSSGPFAGMPLPHGSSRANSAHIVRSHVSTYLISHPHLDHIAGFVINTAAFHATSRPKTLAALPFTVDAIKKYIFNDVIWPNLTDEDGGVGFVTFQRLKEGGDIMVGEGEGRGYIEVCEGLGAKGFKISHGKCMRQNSMDAARNSISNLSDGSMSYATTPRYPESRIMSMSHIHLPGTPGIYHSSGTSQSGTSHPFQQQQQRQQEDANSSPVDSTAYFIRDTTTAREVLIFGDVEPDSVSIFPRLARVWSEATPKIASGILTGVFIECSYDDSQTDAVLFGHMAPRHLVSELQTLAEMVREERIMRATQRAMRKRKRTLMSSTGLVSPPITGGTSSGAAGGGASTTTTTTTHTTTTTSSAIATASAVSALREEEEMFLVEKKQRSRSVVGRNVIAHFRRSSVPDEVVLSSSTTIPEPPSSVPRDYISAGHFNSSGGVTTPRSSHHNNNNALHSGSGSLSLDGGVAALTSSPAVTSAGIHQHHHIPSHEPPLKGLRVMIMHVKDTMKDGPHVCDLILEQVLDHTAALAEKGFKLGCEFEICEPGGSYWF